MVIDVVDVPKESHLGGFPGIFADQLPERCFLGKDQLLLNSMWGSTATAIYVDLEKKTISPAPHFSAALEDTKGSSTGTFSDASCQVIDVLSASDGGADADHYILYSVSAPNRPQQLALRQYREGKFSLFVAPRPKDIAITASATANKYSTSDAVPKLAPSTDEQLRGIRWKVLRFSEDGIPFDAILLTPPATPPSGVSQKKRALVVIPHGGPHSCTPTAFSPAYAYLCLQLDAAILHVNYRGSTGFGSASVRHLQGRIGQSDVADLVTATKAALADPEACIDPERVGVSGGSHGGFLSSHCIGQHPDIFKVTAMRNPVTNIPPMASVSDIPDWCYIEAMGPGNYDFSTFGLPKDPVAAFAAMRECSPVAHIDKVRAPTLLLLGAKDRRVPVSQGIEYYHLLKARGVPTKMLLFPEDDHALDKPSTEADQWVASANWLGKYLN
jgi:acylaminoacyl-peptidase